MISQNKARAARAADDAPFVDRDDARRHEPFPLTDVQKAYWLGRSGAFALGRIGTHLYWELEAVELDVARLEAAWNRLIERHAMLGAVVLPTGEQRVLESVPAYRIRATTAATDPRAVREALEATRAEMSRQVFAVDRWPLFDIRVTPRGAGMARIHLSFDCIPIDGWSLQILFAEWSALYRDPAAPLRPVGIEFRDCVLGAAERRDAEVLRSAAAYWQSRVAEIPPPPALPLVRDPGSVDDPRFRRREVRLDRDAYARLKSAAGRARVTLSTFLLTAYADVLAYFSRDPHFTLNLTLLDRPPLHPDVERVVGDFTSLLLFAVPPRDSSSFEQRAAALQAALWRDMDHRAYHGLEVMREVARRSGDARRLPFGVIFTSALVGADFELSALGKLGFGLTQTSQVWLDHQIYEVDGELALVWDAVDELFPLGFLDDMFSSYEGLVRAVSARAPSALLPSGQRERRRLVNDTRRPAPSGLLHDALARGAAQGPSRPAVIASDRVLTYAEVDAESNRIGRLLRERGARPGELVAIVMRKGWAQVVAVLGTLKSGAAYLPIDADLPGARINALLARGEVARALTTRDVATSFPWPPGVEVLAVDAPLFSDVESSPLRAVQSPRDLAYVIYTSGSTGEPKGVMVTHEAALNTIVDVNERLSASPEDRVLALSALSFDLSVYDIFGMLACGGAIVLPRPAASPDPRAWIELIAAHSVTIWNSVPALMELVVESPGASLRTLRHALLSGDWIPATLPDRIRAIAPDAAVTSLGGATEASIWSILYPIGKVDPAWKSIPYGRPMVNQTFHILDERFEGRPDWVPGELYIGGLGLAKGYWRDPELTKQKFVTHPTTGARLYRTGDFGRYLPSGDIEFLGRVDTQVKIGGYRIECGEIEVCLSRHPSVRQCAVVVKRDATNRLHLVAYVVPSEGGAKPSHLRDFLAETLPHYMVPAMFVTLDALPLTANGKLDAKALPAPESLDDAGASSRAPENATEEALLEIVARELGRSHVGVEDNFFELGGDSIHALRILYTIARVFEAELTMDVLLEDPTVAGLALAVQEAVLRKIEDDDARS